MTTLKLTEFLKESTDDVDTTDLQKIVIAPGRFNPPHRGHKSMIENLQALSKEINAVPVIIIVDSGKYGERNPLTGELRELYLKEMFPGIKTTIAKNPYDAVVNLYEEGFIPVGGVVGKDRADSYRGMIGRIFGDSVKNQYQEEVLTRDPDSDDIAGISASKVREAVKEGNLARFRAMVDLDRGMANELFALIKEGMQQDVERSQG